MKTRFLTVLIAVLLLFSACADSGIVATVSDEDETQTEDSDLSAVDWMIALLNQWLSIDVQQLQTEVEEKAQQEELEKEMFNRFYYTDDQLAEELFREIIQIIENQDHAAMKALFSSNTIASAGDIDSDIVAIFAAYEGKLISYERIGPHTHSSKNGDKYIKYMNVIYDISTTSGVFSIAFRVCTIDSHEPGNLGIQSFYLLLEENMDMRVADWNSGINIY